MTKYSSLVGWIWCELLEAFCSDVRWIRAEVELETDAKLEYDWRTLASTEPINTMDYLWWWFQKLGCQTFEPRCCSFPYVCAEDAKKQKLVPGWG